MKCSKCGVDLKGGTAFCTNCGKKVENKVSSFQSNALVKGGRSVELNGSLEDSCDEAAKEKTNNFWEKMSLFEKIWAVSAALAFVLLIVALCMQERLPLLFSVLQCGGMTVAILMHKHIIKNIKETIEYLILAVAVLISVLNIASYSWFKSVGVDSDDSAVVCTPYDAVSCKGKEKTVVRLDFESVGFFNITEKAIEDLDITEADREGNVESVSINGVSNFDGNSEFNWLANVVITYHTFKRIEVPLSSEEIENMEADVVLTAFKEAGFTKITAETVYDLDLDKSKNPFENSVSIDGVENFIQKEKFPINANVKITTHLPYDKHTVDIIVDFVPNLIFSTYDVNLEIGEHVEKMKHGKDAEFSYKLKEGEYKITFYKSEDRSVSGTVELSVTGDTVASYKINCYSDRISVDTLYVENKGDVGKNEVMVPLSAADCKYKNYKEVEATFKKAGFTDISTKVLYDIVLGWTEEGEVEKVSINGDINFQRGEIVSKDAPVVIAYHMKEEDNPNATESSKTEATNNENTNPVFYSTNDYETAKKGNTGVFSYKNKSGSYDIYWIIDFDLGYVYNFTEGNDNPICDKVKIVSGDLNDRITVTWHDGDDQWTWYLHFKYVNHPVTLVVNDHYGFAYEFTTTDLGKALIARSKKEIVTY
ncbi:MAG: zinc ribbon domain-containing protein [Clostridia bacterium]|nr:zinc ribbon domain-containing protein [Clostridia bacterium]